MNDDITRCPPSSANSCVLRNSCLRWTEAKDKDRMYYSYMAFIPVENPGEECEGYLQACGNDDSG